MANFTTEAQRSQRLTEIITQRIITEISYRIIGCAIEVHKHIGPGLLESVYHTCMMDELVRNDFAIQSHVAVPIFYKGRQLAEPLRLDLMVEDLIIVELKAVETIQYFLLNCSPI